MKIVSKAQERLKNNLKNKTIAVLGLSFKPDTDDMRDAPSIIIIRQLLRLGAKIKTYDPIAMDNARKIFADEKNIKFSPDSYSAVENADLLIILTEWNEFQQLDLKMIKTLMKKALIIDGRNIYDPELTKTLGFTYLGVGR